MAEIDELEQRLNNLESLAGEISGFSITGQEYYLLGFDSAEDGKAIVSIGDPDTAVNTGVYVPGTGTNLEDISGSINRAEVMAWEAHRAAPDEETAVVMWFDFDSPDNPVLDSPSLSYAKDAAPVLAAFTEGLEATSHDPERTTTTVVGHSYGTTVVGEASRAHGLETDHIMAVASPGVNAGIVEELDVAGEDFYATTNPNDMIQVANLVDNRQDDGWLGLGPDPTSDDFGGNTFASDSMTWNPKDAHGTYWDKGNEARQHMGLILTGQGGQTQ